MVGLGWSRPSTGAFLGGFIIIYGQMQSWSPQLVLSPLQQSPANKYVTLLWVTLLSVVPFVMSGVVLGSDVFQDHQVGGMTAILVTGIAAFCILFAVNSAVHSYLILRYSEGDKVAMNVGFYYMSNAMGRLVGTICSGALYSYAGDSRVDGFGWCFVLSAAFCVACIFMTILIDDDQAGLRCGGLVCILPVSRDATSRKGSDAALTTVAAPIEPAVHGKDPHPPLPDMSPELPVVEQTPSAMERWVLEDPAVAHMAPQFQFMRQPLPPHDLPGSDCASPASTLSSPSPTSLAQYALPPEKEDHEISWCDNMLGNPIRPGEWHSPIAFGSEQAFSNTTSFQNAAFETVSHDNSTEVELQAL